MLPIDGILSPEDKSYRSAIIAPNSFEYNFLYLAGYLTTTGGFARFDTIPTCFYVELYRPDEFVKSSFYQDYLDGEFDVEMGDYTIVWINRCYPDWY